MKTTTVLFLLFFALAKTNALNYQISFSGTGAASTVDSVQVDNLTQCTAINLAGADLLNLTSATGINELNQADDAAMFIYPSPMTGNCMVDFEASEGGISTFELYDLTGRRIFHQQELLNKGAHTYALNGLGSGTYLLKIAAEKFSYSAKLVSINSVEVVAEMKHIGTSARKHKSKNSSNALTDVPYTTGDLLKLTGRSGIYKTVVMLVPSASQTVTFNFVACTDADNNNYAVVQIGNQLWMAENLNTTKYNNGDSLPLITSSSDWQNIGAAACCNYDFIPANSLLYGKLYNWFAASESRSIAPSGWHVPTDAEWNILEKYIDNTVDTTATGYVGTNVGFKLKEACSVFWNSSDTGNINSSGFSARPGGQQGTTGSFSGLLNTCNFWSSTPDVSTYAWRRALFYNQPKIDRNSNQKRYGFSVRCVKD